MAELVSDCSYVPAEAEVICPSEVGIRYVAQLLDFGQFIKFGFSEKKINFSHRRGNNQVAYRAKFRTDDLELAAQICIEYRKAALWAINNR